jgi:hypothetical protein
MAPGTAKNNSGITARKTAGEQRNNSDKNATISVRYSNYPDSSFSGFSAFEATNYI